jgi:hypothetical protein
LIPHHPSSKIIIFTVQIMCIGLISEIPPSHPSLTAFHSISWEGSGWTLWVWGWTWSLETVWHRWPI